jgi:signal recognition particle subunit SRP14
MGTKHLSNDEVRLSSSYFSPAVVPLNYVLTLHSPPQFLNRLTTLLSTTHTATHGSVFLTQKPLSATSASSPSIPSSSTSQPQILIRATNGKSKEHRKKGEKEKLSTVVDVGALEEFYRRYAEVCKKGMEGLRKRDRKGKKRKEKEKGKGKKGGAGGGSGGGQKAA